MSLENAKTLVDKLDADPELMATFEADAQAALAAGDYGCTFDELKEAAEAVLLSREIDEGELAAVAGGGEVCIRVSECSYSHSVIHRGGCSDNYYSQQCAATVELYSTCSSNDKCARWDVVYTYANGAEPKPYYNPNPVCY